MGDRTTLKMGPVTLCYDAAGIEDWAWTFRLDRTHGGTRLTWLLSDPGDNAWAPAGPDFAATVDGMATRLASMVDQSLAADASN